MAARFLALAAVVLALAGAVSAAAAGAELGSVSPQPVAPGGTLAVDGTGFPPDEDVGLYWNHRYTWPPDAEATADDSGAVHLLLVVPGVTDGEYDVAACPELGSCTDATAAHHAVEVLRRPPTPAARIAPVPPPPPRPQPRPTATPSPTPSPTLAPAPPAPVPPVTAAPQPPPPLYSAGAVLGLQVSLVALKALTGGGAAAAHHDQGHAGKLAGSKVKHLSTTSSAMAAGDRSPTWRWPGTGLVDSLTHSISVGIAPVSPLMARLVADGGGLRAMVGSPSMLLPVTGAVLGGLAVHDTGGHAVPPGFALLAAICVLGVFDTLAGAAAAFVFIASVVLSGGVSTAGDARVLLGLGGIWFAAPLVAGAARPLRRAPSESLADWWDRLADFVIASLIGAWLVQKVASAFAGLAGHHVALVDQANPLAVTVLCALVARMLLESVVAAHYPGRLAMVHPERIPWPGTAQRIAASVLRTAILVLVAVAFIPVGWQLWTGAALFLMSQLAGIFEDRFPSWPPCRAVVPRGIVKIVFLLLVGRWCADLLTADIHGREQLIADGFWMLMLPGVVLSFLDILGREGKKHPLRWRHRVAELGVLAVGLALVLVQ